MHHEVFIHPGLGDSDKAHWQSRWLDIYPDWVRVKQQDWDHPKRDVWVQQLDASLPEDASDTIVVAHSLGCLTLAHWAVTIGRPLRGALLVALPDPELPALKRIAPDFSPLPHSLLPFPTTIIASQNDPWGDMAFANEMALAWGSSFVDLGEAGHINGESGLGDWPEGMNYLNDLLNHSAP
ncbi:RBBP9/YdeN family alpha/beta hydrolase [Pokkaliibacter sp. CJK22405]|uniref:RBBP9/YdeN family alpha/beta hydrolase n=1 Tax=Pokkaliibacter sp. CJK22405 TaxID=3384615 RepID=UPI0039851E37